MLLAGVRALRLDAAPARRRGRVLPLHAIDACFRAASVLVMRIQGSSKDPPDRPMALHGPQGGGSEGRGDVATAAPQRRRNDAAAIPQRCRRPRG